MRLLLLSAYFPPDVGSAAHLFYELGQAFAAHGHSVSVVTGFPGYHAQGDLSHYNGRRWLRETMDGMDVHRIRVPQVARNTPMGRGLWQFSCAASLALVGLRIPHADIALVYSPPLPLGLSVLAWRLLRGIPFVFNVQDLFPQSAIDLGVLRQRPLIRFFEALERFIYQHADAITVHSSGNRDHVLARGGQPERTFVIYNSVDSRHVRPGPVENALRQELGLNGHFVASFAGVMGYSQDLDVILEAALLLRDHADIRFLLVGDGVEKERLMRKSQAMGLPNIVWLPMQSREHYPSVLQASDVGLTTLHAKVKTPVVPSKILSVMAAGRPVVAVLDLRGDAPRLIAEAEAGYCLPPEQPQALADALLKLYNDPVLCQRFGESGRRYAEAHLSPTAIAERYERLFAELTTRWKASQCRLLEGKA